MIADGGDFVGTAVYILKPRKPLRWLDPGVFGTLGVGAGFALAAKTVNPGSEVLVKSFCKIYFYYFQIIVIFIILHKSQQKV